MVYVVYIQPINHLLLLSIKINATTRSKKCLRQKDCRNRKVFSWCWTDDIAKQTNHYCFRNI